MILPTGSKRGEMIAPLAFVITFLVHAHWLSGLAEDSFISYRFARHLAQGHGWVWNLGEAPVEGFTNLLWVVVAAAAEAFGAAPERVTVALGLAAGLGTLAVTDRLAARGLGLGPTGRVLAAGLLALSGPLAAWSASGLETVPFTFLVYAALAVLLDPETGDTPRALAGGWALVAAATLTRPEGALLAGLLGLGALPRGPARRARATAACAYGAFVIGLTVFRWLHFDALLPNTFYAKTGGGLEQLERGAQYAGYFALHFLAPLFPLVLLGLARQGERSAGSRRPAAMLTVWALGMTLYIVAVGGDYMAMDRFFVPVLPALVLLALSRADSWLREAWESPPARRVALLAGLVALAGTFVQSTPLEADLFAKAPRQHGTYRGVETERWHVARLEVLARFFAERAAAHPNASLATGAIGVLGDRTRLAVYDFHGLVDSAIARGGTGQKALGTGLPGHEKTDWKRILDRRPTYWMFTRALRDEPAEWPRYDPETDRRLRDEYELVSVELEDPINGERGFFTFLERKASA
jgi:hypothetical protein